MSVFDNMFKKPSSSVKSPKRKTTKKSDSWIEEMISKPVHGHGSGEGNLKDMYEAQQQILHDRRTHALTKQALKKKYQNSRKDYLSEIKTIDQDPADLNKKEDDAMWVDESSSFKFPWDSKNKLKP